MLLAGKQHHAHGGEIRLDALAHVVARRVSEGDIDEGDPSLLLGQASKGFVSACGQYGFVVFTCKGDLQNLSHRLTVVNGKQRSQIASQRGTKVVTGSFIQLVLALSSLAGMAVSRVSKMARPMAEAPLSPFLGEDASFQQPLVGILVPTGKGLSLTTAGLQRPT